MLQWLQTKQNKKVYTKTMLYRRKLVLALLELSNGSLQATQLQKYTFEVSRHQVNSSYNFVPYKYGCSSFDLTADLNFMKKQSLLTSLKQSRSEFWIKTAADNFFDMLKDDDKRIVR